MKSSKPFVAKWPRFMDAVIGWAFLASAAVNVVDQLTNWYLGRNSSAAIWSFCQGAITILLLMEAVARLATFARARRLGIAETPVVHRWPLAPDEAMNMQPPRRETALR